MLGVLFVQNFTKFKAFSRLSNQNTWQCIQPYKYHSIIYSSMANNLLTRLYTDTKFRVLNTFTFFSMHESIYFFIIFQIVIGEHGEEIQGLFQYTSPIFKAESQFKALSLCELCTDKVFGQIFL